MKTQINCIGFTTLDYPQLKRGMYLECFNGSKGSIDQVYLNAYFTLDTGEYLHLMDIKFISF